MKKDIVEKAIKLLPDVKLHPKDTVSISIIKIDPDKEQQANPEINYCYSVKFKKVFEEGVATNWEYISMSISSMI